MWSINVIRHFCGCEFVEEREKIRIKNKLKLKTHIWLIVESNGLFNYFIYSFLIYQVFLLLINFTQQKVCNRLFRMKIKCFLLFCLKFKKFIHPSFLVSNLKWRFQQNYRYYYQLLLLFIMTIFSKKFFYNEKTLLL